MSAEQAARHPVLAKAGRGEDLLSELTAPRTQAPAVCSDAPTQLRRGPGRPRGRRRMEPFSSKIEIALRDDVDRYLAQHDETMVDLIDRALRSAISQPPIP